MNLPQKLSLALSILGLHHGNAAEIVRPDFGFRIQIPKGFEVQDGSEADPDTLYQYLKVDSEDGAPWVILIERMRGVISPDDRMDLASMPEAVRDSVTLKEIEWNGHTLDVMVALSPLPDGGTLVNYSIQYPLSKEAVQMNVAGFADRDAEVWKLFSQVCAGFTNTRPLYGAANEPANPGGKLSAEERITKGFSGVAKLAIVTAMLVVAGGAVVRRFMRKEKGQKGAGPGAD